MLSKLTPAQRTEFEKIVSMLGQSLDITKTQYEALVKSYEAVGEFLQNDPELSQYNPIVTPQGSLRLGTIIQPITQDGDIDVDLVFRLMDKHPLWTQKDIKDKVGNRLKASERYAPMMKKKEGSRCWTLFYRQDSDRLNERYHMDILPAVASHDYEEQMRQVLSEAFTIDNANRLSIRITDKDRLDYPCETNPSEWLKSNPDGYALWFASRCKENISKRQMLTEDIVPLKKFNSDKTPLQRIVQILKRHRDMMFRDDEEKPISIIITTLAAKAYKGETDILEGLVNVVMKLDKGIELDENGNDKVANPLNPEENFADKWIKTPTKRTKFYDWLIKIRADLASILGSRGPMLWENMGKFFGRSISESTSKLYTGSSKTKFDTHTMRISATGALGAIGQTLNAANTFHGKEA